VRFFSPLLLLTRFSAVAIHSLYQVSQSVAAVVGTHLALCLAYLAIDLFKYRRMSLFLFKSYETLGDQLDQIAATAPSHPPPTAATKINSDGSIAYVPVERQQNWANVLGDIRNFKGKGGDRERPQMIDGVPVIKIGQRTSTYTKLALKPLESEEHAISIPRLQSASSLPQRRGSADSSRVIRVMRAASPSDTNGGSDRDNINLSRGRSAVDLRKRNLPDQQTISLQRTLTQAQISGMIGNGRDRRAKGNFIEDENGKIRERILIRRKRSAPNKESLNLPPDFHPESIVTGAASGSPFTVSQPPLPPMEQITETNTTAMMVIAKSEMEGTESADVEEDVIKLTRTR
jgi:hypothetical protein